MQWKIQHFDMKRNEKSFSSDFMEFPRQSTICYSNENHHNLPWNVCPNMWNMLSPPFMSFGIWWFSDVSHCPHSRRHAWLKWLNYWSKSCNDHRLNISNIEIFHCFIVVRFCNRQSMRNLLKCVNESLVRNRNLKKKQKLQIIDFRFENQP